MDNLPGDKFCGECETALIGQTPTALPSYPQPSLIYAARHLTERRAEGWMPSPDALTRE
jgi:hypothetical protein